MATSNASPLAKATPSIAHLATDPLRNFKFNVNITTEVIPYREGGMNTTTQKMPGQSDFAPITLSQGVAVGSGPMWQWMKELFTVMQGTGTGSPGKDFRATVDIMVLDHPVTTST